MAYSCWKYDYADDWIIENYPGKCTKAFFKAYCDKTGYTGNIDCLRKHIRSLGVKQAPWKAYTKEMDEWLIENYPKLGRVASITKFQELFDVEYAFDSIGHHATDDLGLRVDREVAYHNRHRLNENQTSYLYKDGELRKEGDKTFIKVNGKWINYRRYLWEKSNGKVPKGYKVTYLDNPEDFSLENTVCVPEKYITLLTSHKLRAENKVITKCGIKWCELYYLAVEQGMIKPRKS